MDDDIGIEELGSGTFLIGHTDVAAELEGGEVDLVGGGHAMSVGRRAKSSMGQGAASVSASVFYSDSDSRSQRSEVRAGDSGGIR
jgi:hypothetical protein